MEREEATNDRSTCRTRPEPRGSSRGRPCHRTVWRARERAGFARGDL